MPNTPAPPPNPNPDPDPDQEDPQILSSDQEQEDPESETSGGPHSPPKGNPVISTTTTLRRSKRKKGSCKNYKSQLAPTKKLSTLSQNLNLIPFIPAKVLDFNRFEVYLKKLDLWEFCKIEFDANLRGDLIAQLLDSYSVRSRGSSVNEYKIGVNRAAIAKALRLPGKKGGDSEEYPDEFILFLVEFVSSWMLLHGDEVWATPNEVVNWLGLIREKHLERIDWAGLVWYMVKKEVSQGSELRNCYYASHLQKLIKEQREHLLMGKGDEVVVVDADDDDGGGEEEWNDVGKVVDGFGAVGDEGEETNVEDDGNVENVDGECKGVEDMKVESVEDGHCVDNVEVVDVNVSTCENAGERAKNACERGESTGESVENADLGSMNTDTCGENADVCIENGDEDTRNAGDEHTENGDEHTENDHDHLNNSDEDAENTEDARGVSMDIEMMDLGYGRGPAQRHWLLSGKTDGGRFSLQRCSMDCMDASFEGRRQDVDDDDDSYDGEDMDEEDNEEDEHVEGFKIMQKGPLHGMTSPNLVQHFETGQLQFAPLDLSQSSLELISSRAENNVIMGNSSVLNHFGKRLIDLEHDIGLNDKNHKKLKLESSIAPKAAADFNTCLEQMQFWFDKAKMSLVATRDEICRQASMNERILSRQITDKDNEILQLKYKMDELHRKKQTELYRRDRELYLMNRVIEGYRRALKQTQKDFTEFRKRHKVPDEPFYKDAGNGGVVKSVTELEKERIKQEEEKKMMCPTIERTFNMKLDGYMLLWEELNCKVLSLECRLKNASEEWESLKERLVKGKSRVSAPNEG